MESLLSQLKNIGMASEKLYRNTLTLTIFQGTGPWTCTLLPNCFKRSLEVMSYESPLL